jgi:TonB family protein
LFEGIIVKTLLSIITWSVILVSSTVFYSFAEDVPGSKSIQSPPQTSHGIDFEDRIPDPSFQMNAEVPPAVVQDVEPVWPDSAKMAGVSGRVSVQFYVDETGMVQQAFVLKSKPKGWGFEEAALNAIYLHKFSPAKLHNVPTGVWMLETFTFKVK